MTVHNHVREAVQALVEVFRTSQEIFSAEYIIIDDGSTEPVSLLLQGISRLRKYFGITITYRRLSKSTGYGAACQLGESGHVHSQCPI
jgi:hypothetical protein